MHVFIMSTKSGLIKTQIVYAVFIVSYNGLHFFFFFFDDFTLSPLGVPPAVRWILKTSADLIHY